MTFPPAVERYRHSRGLSGPWRLAGEARRDFRGAIVIPALAEEASLFSTLRGLVANPATLRHDFLTIVVVNHAIDAATEVRAENARTLQLLGEEGRSLALPLAWVDAASPGLELPAGGGVGMARKLGFDLALERLDWSTDPLLISLDADTLVRPDYLPAIGAHFRQARCGGAVLPFCHQLGESAGIEAAIVQYELFLRSYALGLARAGSPYGFPAIGSAMACRAEAYVRSGGMNRRAAGEDFYFLQQLVKTAGVAQLSGTVVHPSPRLSSRTPFGTGRSMQRLMDGEEDAVLFHPVACYRLLAEWLTLAADAWDRPAPTVSAAARALHPCLGEFLEKADLGSIWPRLQKQNRKKGAFLAAFHAWFDGLRTRQLLYRLSAGPFPGRSPAETLPALLAWAGLKAATDPLAQLAELRACANDCGFPEKMQYCRRYGSLIGGLR